MLDAAFKSPPDICRGTDFWMLNDRLDPDEIVRQLREMRSQGVASVIARTYIGLKSDYPGADWMLNMRALVGEAKRLGITVFMQAGYMPEAVLNLPAEYSLGNLTRSKIGQGDGELILSKDGYDYRLSQSMTILDMLSKEACAFYVKQSYEDMWREFKSEFGKTIISVWVDEPSFRKVSLPWTGSLPETYREMWGEDFPLNKTHLLFADGSGDRELRLRYWRTVMRLMKNAYFASIRDWCVQNNVCFSGHLMAEDSLEDQIRATCSVMPMYQYFDIPGIDYLTAEMNWVHGEIKPEKPYDKTRSGFAAYNTPIQCASAAHQAGRELVLAEMHGVSTENLNLRDQKHMFDHFASLGINHRSLHGIFYSLRGRAKRAYPPHVNYYQPYWRKYHLLTDALARESAFLRAGAPVRDVLVLSPIETAFGLYHAASDVSDALNAGLKRYDLGYNQLLRELVGIQCNFELGDEDVISECGSVDGGLFRVGKMAYSTVVMPRMRIIRESTVLLLEKFMANGGAVVIYGDAPEATDTGAFSPMDRLSGAVLAHTFRELSDALSVCKSAYRFEARESGADVQIHYREQGGDRLVFLMNANCRFPAFGYLVVEGKYSCERFSETDGEIYGHSAEYANGETRVPADIAAGGSLMLRLRRGTPKTVDAKPKSVIKTPLRAAEWRMKREDPNALILEMFRFATRGEPLSDETYPVISIQERLLKVEYEGELELSADFTLKCPMGCLKLAIESPETQRLEIDGKPVSSAPDGKYICFAFETVPLPDLSAGRHTLTIRRRFELMRKPKSVVTMLFENLGGTELEPVMLIGDFAVRSPQEPTSPECVRVNYDFALSVEDETCGGNATVHGYPFYCGVMDLETDFIPPDGAAKATLSLEGLNAAAAEIVLNGEICGDMAFMPYECSLKNLRSGKNTLKIRLFGTLRNLLGPWHRPVGEIGACWGGTYAKVSQPWQGVLAHETGNVYPDWYIDRKPDRDGWTESYIVLPLGIAEPVITFE